MAVMAFIIGFFFGGIAGFAITVLCMAGSQADQEAERHRNSSNSEEE